MDKDLFLRVYQNKIFNLIINNQIKEIHKKLLLLSVNWKELIQSPKALLQYGYLDVFKTHYEVSSIGANEDLDLIAAKYGHFHLLRSIIEYHKPKDFRFVFRWALRGGHMSIIEYIYSLLGHYDYDEIDNCAKSGRMEVCEWFSNQTDEDLNQTDEYQFFKYAALYGYLEVFKWGIQNIDLHFSDYKAVWRNAICSKNIYLLDYMFSINQFKNAFPFSDHIDTILWSNNKVIDFMFSKAYTSRSISKVLYSLIDMGCEKTIEYISTKWLGYKIGDNKNLAYWFFEICNKDGFNAIDRAIINKNFNIMKWIQENTDFQSTFYLDPLDELEHVFASSSFDILKWYIENRLETIPPEPLDLLLRKKSNLNIVEYILRYRKEQFSNTQLLMDFLLVNSDSGDEWADCIIKDPNVTFLNDVMDRSISNNRFRSVKWLHENTTIGCSREGIKSAYFLKDSTMIEWLLQNRTESCHPDTTIISDFHRYSKPVQSFIVYNKPDSIPLNVLEHINNDIKLSNFIISRYPNQFIHEDTLLTISKSGKVEIVKYLHEYYKKYDINIKTKNFNLKTFKQSLEISIRYGYIDIVKYLCENGPKIQKSAGKNLINQPMLAACKYGRLDICKYLQQNTTYQLNSIHLDTASVNGNLEVVQWINQTYGFKCSDLALKTTAINGQFKVVRYLLNNNHKLSSDMFGIAIKGFDLELVELCHKYRCECKFNAVNLASSLGSLQIVKYLVHNGYKGTSDAIDSASKRGYLDLIMYLAENNHNCTLKSIKRAIKYSKYKVIRWLLNNYEFQLKNISFNDIDCQETRNLLIEYYYSRINNKN